MMYEQLPTNNDRKDIPGDQGKVNNFCPLNDNKTDKPLSDGKESPDDGVCDEGQSQSMISGACEPLYEAQTSQSLISDNCDFEGQSQSTITDNCESMKSEESVTISNIFEVRLL